MSITISKTFFVLCDLTVVRSSAQAFCRMSFSWDRSGISPVYTEIMSLGEEDNRGEVPF